MAEETQNQDVDETEDTETVADTSPTTVSMTQAELDRMIAKRVKRAETAVRQAVTDEQAAASMSETERLKAEKDAADARAQNAITTANTRAIRAEARIQALTLGVRPERVAAALKLADLTDVTVDDQGEPDVASITASVTAMLADYPEFKTTPQSNALGKGTNPADGASKPASLLEQYQAAQQAGNVSEMIRLNREMHETAGQR